MSGYDPSTGESIGYDDLSALINAASECKTEGAMVDDVTPVPLQRSEPLCDGVLAVRLMDHTGAIKDQFDSLDKHEAASRICALVSCIRDTYSRVCIDCGSLSAVVCLHTSGNCYTTSWMCRASAAASKGTVTPAAISYNADQLSEWALLVSTSFINALQCKKHVEQLRHMWAQRRAGEAAEQRARLEGIPPTPATGAWLENEAPSMAPDVGMSARGFMAPSEHFMAGPPTGVI